MRLAVPWYVHPSDDPAGWTELSRLASRISFVVVNVHNGPAIDPAYPQALGLLRATGIRMLGYVDTRYGTRPVREVAGEVRRWIDEHDVRGVFFDCAASSIDQLDRYRLYSLYARSLGAELIAGNPGVPPHSGYVELFDVTCVFEGSYAAYCRYRPPAELSSAEPDRIWHLIHNAPPARHKDVLAAARDRGAGHVHVSHCRGANPWTVLPPCEHRNDEIAKKPLADGSFAHKAVR